MTGPTKTKRTLLEIACFDAESAITAYKAGADRIELCDGKEDGGTTPSLASVKHVKQHVSIPVYLMIRPRGGNFVYSDDEFRQMQTNIDDFKPLADGFVFGVLDRDGRVDVTRTSELVQRARPLPCTFHRAFDKANGLITALEDVVSTGCEAILTSGGEPTASEGLSSLAALNRMAGDRIQVLPGGGVRAANIQELQMVTRAVVFHSSGIPDGAAGVDGQEIRRMQAVLRNDDGCR